MMPCMPKCLLVRLVFREGGSEYKDQNPLDFMETSFLPGGGGKTRTLNNLIWWGGSSHRRRVETQGGERDIYNGEKGSQKG